MIEGKKIIAVVPARAGSKGIRNKNLLKISGKPLVCYPIKAALQTKYIDFVFCSTDSPMISKIARSMGADVSYLRGKKLASDKAKSTDVLLDAINFFEKSGQFFDYIIMVEPTSPLTENFDLDNAIEKLHENRAKFDSIISVAKSLSGHPQFTFTLSKTGRVNPIAEKPWIFTRRQDLKPYFFQTGTFYISKVEALKRHNSFVTDKTMGIEVQKRKSFEIDDYTDFVIIQALSKARNLNE